MTTSPPDSPSVNTDANGPLADNDLDFFAPLLPWQQQAWSQLTAPQNQAALPHALLAAGIEGIGKRAFVWRLVAWLLCRQRDTHPLGACGVCESCDWLKSGTHPNLQVLPLHSLPMVASDEASASPAKAGKSAAKDGADTPKRTIKIDDIRQLISFVHQGSQGIRVCVFDYAEQMTIGAANALLKTLEEPQPQVHLLLITDSPAQLLPTIKSRVQQLPLQRIPFEMATSYIKSQLGQQVSEAEVAQLLSLANGAPLAAVAMASARWYSKRKVWLTVWLALRAGKRSAMAASDYWQKELTLAEFTQLTELMLMDLNRIVLGLDSLQPDCEIAAALPAAFFPSIEALDSLAEVIAASKRAILQNVQEKLAYDKLMQSIAQT